jgi:hypothetical protein
MLTQSRLKELYEYRDGFFYKKDSGLLHKPTPLTDHHRYARLVVDGKAYAMHRLVFLYCHGYLPKIIDHIDNDRTNNKIENLREVTQQQNCLNRITHKNNSSGMKNIHFDKGVKKWCVGLYVNKKRKIFGYFADLELAELVAIEARNKFHGSFARS